MSVWTLLVSAAVSPATSRHWPVPMQTTVPLGSSCHCWSTDSGEHSSSVTGAPAPALAARQQSPAMPPAPQWSSPRLIGCKEYVAPAPQSQRYRAYKEKRQRLEHEVCVLRRPNQSTAEMSGIHGRSDFGTRDQIKARGPRLITHREGGSAYPKHVVASEKRWPGHIERQLDIAVGGDRRATQAHDGHP